MLARSLVVRSAALLVVAALPLAGCQTNTGTALDKKASQGAIAGVLAGAAAGAAIDSHKRGRGAAIGAVVGGLTGGLIGNYLDKQARELDAIPDANIERRQESLIVAFPSDVLFDVGSFALNPGAYGRLDQVADTLRRYPDTNVVIKGHTDATGDESYNLRLSEDRADSVRRYLVSRGVADYRITSIGMGEAMPLATNATPEGRQQNRRVELEIKPNDDLRQRQQQQGGADPYDGGSRY